ncbi:hypothetical protein C8Q78DRAFT_621684 [Trametes maxima]|nr:hypothetical protein C8Q78DRAFT_621684 [Trametes maxima]
MDVPGVSTDYHGRQIGRLEPSYGGLCACIDIPRVLVELRTRAGHSQDSRVRLLLWAPSRYMAQAQHPKLPSVLPSTPAVQDVLTTSEHIGNCYRLFPSRDRVMLHRKRDHDSEDQEDIITWND